MTSCTLPEAPALFESAGEEDTLDELITSVWEGLRAHVTVECPVCHAEMAPAYGVHARAVGGSCSTCGSTLR